MPLKKAIVNALSPSLFFLLKKTIKLVKSCFLWEDERLKNVLSGFGFHPALCYHPSILFGERAEGKAFCLLLKFHISFLRKCIKLGLLKSVNGHRLIHELGIQPCFGNGKEFWFVESHSPIVPYSIPDNPKPNGRIVVYTALTGDYDNVQELLYKEDGVDYLLFTNNPSIHSNTWQVIQVQSGLDEVLLSREIKMMPHKYLGKEYETSIYIDANAIIYGEITELTRYLANGKSLAVTKHSIRKSVKEEIDACVRLRGTDQEAANKQYEKYLNEGFNDDNPLLECGILVRAHNDQTLQALMCEWFDEFKNGVRRDQLSLLPCISRLGFKDYVIMEGSVWHNQFNKIQSHKR